MRLFGFLLKYVHAKVDVVFHQLNTIKSAGRVKRNSSALHDLLISMPKESVHVPQLKAGRSMKKEVNSKFPAGFIRLEVLGNGAKGAPASLYLFTDQTRYLFNCGEGTQRLAHEYKMKLAKLEHIFITNSTWKEIGGIPGVALTIQDIGVPSIVLHGPAGLEYLFEGCRRFVILKDLKVSVADPDAGFFEDHVMRIDYVKLLPKTTAKTENKDAEATVKDDEVDEIDYYSPIKGCKRNLEIEGRSLLAKKSKTEAPSGHAFCYICRPKPKAGALLIQKCIEYGVPAGPLLGELKRGEDVTLANGHVVRAADVRSKAHPATVFIIVDCPSENYLDALLNNDALSKYQGDDVSPDNFVYVMVHFTPKEVFTNPKYTAWLQGFRMSTKHIVLNELCVGMGSEAVHRAQYRLNVVDPALFPVLRDLDQSEIRDDPLTVTQLPLVTGSTQLRFNLRPELGLDTSAQLIIDGEMFVKDLLALPEFESSMEQLKTIMSEDRNNELTAVEYPRLTFLGTGSCIPNKTRNTSGILINISPSSSMMLDCGEGSYGQLVRFLGSEVENVLVELNAIFISHLHADHHLGLINLLQQRHRAFINRNLTFRPVYLVSPHQILSWLQLYDKKFERISQFYEIIPTSSVLYPSASIDPVLQRNFYETTELTKIETVQVRHCPNAYGVALTGGQGWKVTYSGDTMPCDSLVTLGMYSDLLIHEATMEDELKDEAVIKMHSTVSEAIEIGKRMNAKFTMLTHFSQRYAKVPKINGGLEGTVGIAFDNMTVRLSDLWKVPLMYPTFKTMFQEYYEDMETKTAKKMKRKEKEKEALA